MFQQSGKNKRLFQQCGEGRLFQQCVEEGLFQQSREERLFQDKVWEEKEVAPTVSIGLLQLGEEVPVYIGNSNHQAP